jgi:hypothetical protein
MAKIDFYTIEKAEKEAIFNAIASELGMTPFAVEKDWWVSRMIWHTFPAQFLLSLCAIHLHEKCATS